MQDQALLEGREYEYTAAQDLSNDPDWLSIARSAYKASTDYLDANYRKQFEMNLSNFRSKHPQGSKYYLDAYKSRSRLFRPKTRTAVRKNESSMAAALFSSADVVVLEAEDQDDPVKRRDAAYWHEVLNYRLDKTLPWFQLCVGAFQEAMVYGCVVSKQYWEYEEAEGDKKMVPDPMYPNLPAMDNDGNPIFRTEMNAIKDRPKVRLIEIENIRFDPACDWLDPINSSPYIIECMPMYVGDVMERMELVDEKTNAPEWNKLDASQIVAYGKESEQEDDTTRTARRGTSEVEADHHVSDFETVWVHENIVRHKGQDWVYYTLSTRFLLSKPKPLEEVYEHGIRPYVLGKAIIEAHKPIPAGTVELGQTLQAEANDTVNQRLDNVKLVLNKRYMVNRNANVDLPALVRNAPGGIILADDVDAVKEQQTRDVTNMAYQEQARIDSDFEDIAGVFSVSSVQNNRQLNETVGGMELMSQYANKETEYLIRTFVETWVEPVLKQVVLLEQYYEDDEHIRDIATKAVQKQEKKITGQDGMPEGQQPDTDEYPIEEPQNVDVRVSVGFGNLSPDQRINKIVNGLKAMAEVAPWAMQNVNAEEVADEIFGAMGHKNGKKYFTDLTRPEPQTPPEVQVKMEELKLKQAALQQDVQYNQAKLQQDYEIAMSKIAMQENITMQQLYAKLGVDEKKMQHEKELAGARNLTTLAEVERKERELDFKARTGRQGI
jgi:hypothetical protein